jgi:hypothetical protein
MDKFIMLALIMLGLSLSVTLSYDERNRFLKAEFSFAIPQ